MLKYNIIHTDYTLLITLLSISLIMILGSCKTKKYPELSEDKIVLKGDIGKWDEAKVHTMSVIEVERDGYKYWAYYGLDYYNDPDSVKKVGLARSNDLISWEKYAGNPIIDSNCRWATAVYANGRFHLFYAEYLSNTDSRIVHVSSVDGFTFSQKKVIVPYQEGLQNQNPFIFYNQADQSYYLFYYHGRERGEKDKKWTISVKNSNDINGLETAVPKEIMSANYTIAAPSITFFNNRFYLLIEAFKAGKWNDKWVTLAYQSQSVEEGFHEVSNNPIFANDDACAFQYVLDDQLCVFYSHRTNQENNDWDLRIARSKK